MNQIQQHFLNVLIINIQNIFCYTGEREREALERDRDSIFRIRDHRRRLETSFRDETLKSLEREEAKAAGAEGKKLPLPSQTPLTLGEELQYWSDKVIASIFYLS